MPESPIAFPTPPLMRMRESPLSIMALSLMMFRLTSRMRTRSLSCGRSCTAVEPPGGTHPSHHSLLLSLQQHTSVWSPSLLFFCTF